MKPRPFAPTGRSTCCRGRSSINVIGEDCGDHARDRRENPWAWAFRRPCCHTAQELVVVFILLGFEVKIAGDLGHARITNSFHIHPQEPVVGVPGNCRGTYGRLLGSCRDLVRMEIT